jgi:hypothetical protein
VDTETKAAFLAVALVVLVWVHVFGGVWPKSSQRAGGK